VHKYSGKHFTVYVKNNFCIVLFYFCVFCYIFIFPVLKNVFKLASKRLAKCSYRQSFMVLQKDLGSPYLGGTQSRLGQGHPGPNLRACLEACQFLIFITQHDVQCSLRVDQAFYKIGRTTYLTYFRYRKYLIPGLDNTSSVG
jgi:hypothetical protein